jgi:DnaK suppressor protein
LLRAELEQRQQQLDHRVAEHHGGLTRAEHARELLEQDHDDAPQREAEREFDLAMSDLELQELGDVSEALRRMADGRYGLCADCEDSIPFDRLKVEPWALRCVACTARREQALARRGS